MKEIKEGIINIKNRFSERTQQYWLVNKLRGT
jgi:hypothetical protein